MLTSALGPGAPTLVAAVAIVGWAVFAVLGVLAWLITPEERKPAAEVVLAVGMSGGYLVFLAVIVPFGVLYVPGIILVVAAPLIYRRMASAR